MKASELRIGMWAMGNKPFIVDANLIHMAYNHERANNGAERFNGIALNEDWLRRAGFEYDTAMYWIELKDKWSDKLKIGLSIQVDGMYLVHFANFNNIITVVEFVHELQNVIKDLTGTELTINN